MTQTINVYTISDSAPFWVQLKVVVARAFLAFWRSPDYGFTRLFQHISIALVVGLTVSAFMLRTVRRNLVTDSSPNTFAVPQPRPLGGLPSVPCLCHLLCFGLAG
mgnify:FL=1|jgi:hypothetical protein